MPLDSFLDQSYQIAAMWWHPLGYAISTVIMNIIHKLRDVLSPGPQFPVQMFREDT
jgi:hypothetical protein